MRKDLIYVSTLGMTEEDWLAYRLNGIGASEVGCVMGLDPFKTPAELFNEKIGREVRPNLENAAKFHGKLLEAYAADLWQYWGGSEESLYQNKKAGKMVRRMRKINAYVTNPDYPWLFVSLDRVINKHSGKGEGALEIKCTSKYMQDRYEGGINPAHIMQLQTQTGVTTLDYGELATFTDGRWFDVYEFEAMPNLFGAVVESTEAFWQRVLKARSLVGQAYEARQGFNLREAEAIEVEINQLEPTGNGSDNYLDFLKHKYKNDNPDKVIEGSVELLNVALEHRDYQRKIDELQQLKNDKEATIKNFMQDAVELNFREAGKITWKANKNGSRVFTNKVK